MQVWGDCKQLEVSVASLEMTSEPTGSVPQSPPQLVQTGCLTNPERRGRELYPCGEGGVVQRSLQREKDSGDSGK